MQIIKASIATAAVLTCCMGNQFPASASPSPDLPPVVADPVAPMPREVAAWTDCPDETSGYIVGAGRTFCIREATRPFKTTRSAPRPRVAEPAVAHHGHSSDVTVSVKPSIRSYCESIVGESYALMETCIEMEEEARQNIGL